MSSELSCNHVLFLTMPQICLKFVIVVSLFLMPMLSGLGLQYGQLRIR